jgi:hypothetical protein
MICDDAVEFISALCDGERISSEAAEHIGACEKCRARLDDYVFASVELRRAASLDSVENVPSIEWLLAKAPIKTTRQESPTPWWKKGTEAMKIPRFAVISMVLLIVGLSSGLLVVRARSNAQAQAVILTLNIPDLLNSPWECALSVSGDQNKDCTAVMNTKNGGVLEANIRFLSKQGDEFSIGVRSQFFAPPTNGVTFSSKDLKNLPMQTYEVQPGGTTSIDISGFGEAPLTAKSLDYIPNPFLPKENLDPKPDEIRIISPVLLRGQEAVLDLKDGVLVDGKQEVVWMYSPQIGRLVVSTQNFPGSVQADANASRINFQADGQQYELVSGLPITRAQTVWVQLDPNFEPSAKEPKGSMGGEPLQDMLRHNP